MNSPLIQSLPAAGLGRCRNFDQIHDCVTRIGQGNADSPPRTGSEVPTILLAQGLRNGTRVSCPGRLGMWARGAPAYFRLVMGNSRTEQTNLFYPVQHERQECSRR
jgi:hypothetical protein